MRDLAILVSGVAAGIFAGHWVGDAFLPVSVLCMLAAILLDEYEGGDDGRVG